MGSLDRETLESLSIHELREVARQVGVHLPTTLKREDLYKEIEDILSGNKEPYKRKTNQGRPPKVSRKFTDLGEVLLPKEVDADYVKTSISPEFVFNSNKVIYESGEELEFSGYLVCYDTYGVIINSDTLKVFVTITLINQYGLVSGDYLLVKYKKLTDGKNIVSSIVQINNVNYDEYENKTVNEIKEKFEISVLNNKISIGGTSLVYNNNFDVNSFANLVDKNYEIYVLNINVKDEEFKNQNNNLNTFNINYKLEDRDMFELSLAIINKAKRVCELNNKNVILIVNSLTELIKVNNACITQNVTINEIKSNVIKNVKSIMASAVNGSNGSFTIIDNENNNLQSSLSDILNYELKLFFDVINN